MKKLEKKQMEWCELLAQLSVDELVDHEMIEEVKFEEAVKVVAQEIYIRVFCLNNYPPLSEKEILKENSQ